MPADNQQSRYSHRLFSPRFFASLLLPKIIPSFTIPLSSSAHISHQSYHALKSFPNLDCTNPRINTPDSFHQCSFKQKIRLYASLLLSKIAPSFAIFAINFNPHLTSIHPYPISLVLNIMGTQYLSSHRVSHKQSDEDNKRVNPLGSATKPNRNEQPFGGFMPPCKQFCVHLGSRLG